MGFNPKKYTVSYSIFVAALKMSNFKKSENIANKS